MGVANFTNNNNNSTTTGTGSAGNNGGLGIPFPGAPGNNTDVSDILVNMNKKQITPVLFRDAVIRQLSGILIAKYKPNALLVGMAGTGKTAIVEELARHIEAKDPSVPPALQNKTIYSLEISDITAGTAFVGALEEKLQDILAFLEDPKNNAVVFIDEIHQLLSGSHDGKKIAQILKPALSRGTIRCIGATTIQEAKDLDKDPAFNRRFTKILVDELTKEQTMEILTSLYPELVRHYNQTFPMTKDLSELIVNTADEFCFAGSHRPDNAITLLDRSISSALLDKLDMLNSPDPAIAAAAKAVPGIVLSENSIRQTALRMVTGNNVPKPFDETEFAEAFSHIKGQDSILQPLVRVMKRHTAHFRPQKKPLAMLFMGPSGCGKTEAAKIIAGAYLQEKPIILNMTEYAGRDSVNKILGSTYGFIGSEDKDEKPFDALEANPYQVILLDEFEKCHESVRKLFMRVLDEGVLKTAKGKTIDFSKAIVIATTNAGCTEGAEAPLGFGSTEEADPSDSQIIKELSAYFERELLNRFTKRYRFHSISRETFKEILKDNYRTEREEILSLKPRVPLPTELSEGDAEELAAKYYNKWFNARPAKEAVSEFIDNIMVP